MLNFVKASLAVVALLTFTVCVEAASLLSSASRQSTKRCDYSPGFQPDCCRPRIVRPTTFHPPRRPSGCGKPESCYQVGCDLDSCCPVVTNCAPVTTACIPAAVPCAPVIPTGACDDSCVATGACPELMELIQRSQTACHSWDRRDAVHKISDRYKCSECPAVMTALIYALNDSDERVRSKAADEIGDQLRACPHCCSVTVLNALKHALGDCDRFVRRQAEEALRAAGYEIVDGNCSLRGAACDVTCVPVGCAPVVIPQTEYAPHGEVHVNPAAPPACPPAAVPVNDATPTGPAVAPVPPPIEKMLPSGPSALTPAIFESGISFDDAPVPSAASSARAQAGSASRGSSPAAQAPAPRRQPLRQTLSSLFNQVR